MMAILKQTQDETAMWLQLVDDPKSITLPEQLNIELERGIYSASPNLTLRKQATPRFHSI